MDSPYFSNNTMVYDWSMCSPETTTNTSSILNSAKECAVCGAPSNGYHFNAPSCSACAAFFRRTVTLNRNFQCAQQSICRVNYTMRVICRACRYHKCVQMGMDRSAVQPRRDCNAGRRKMLYHEIKHISSTTSTISNPSPPPPSQIPSYSSSISEEISPNLAIRNDCFEAEQLLDDLLREERLFNERRRMLYCAHSSISDLLTNDNLNDIPFTCSDLRPLTFSGIQKQIRPQILLIYEWLRGWRHFQMLDTSDRFIFLRRCVLYHTVLDPSYLTYRLGFPTKYVMFNAMYVGIDENDQTGWEDEDSCIKSELKKKLYRPLMERTINEIISAMRASNLSFVEFVFLKALVSFKASASSDISKSLKKFMHSHMDLMLKALSLHYQSLGLSKEETAQRTGNLVLMMSNVFAVGMECLESHQKIQFFDLWQLDDLLIKLINRSDR
ncbi:unnamed protein product [Caenorhabditis angaria]|uniref:Uncharacterized protein n=1 Tax=Caenorhabditis angaria TaxID=860376 RepID=A0A9P1IJB3_9PELO|nr:unnamed protein product [Caenorhabditis angaria]